MSVKDPAFELLHPRVRAGRPGDGKFVDVLGKVREMGGDWDDEHKAWVVPHENVGKVEALLDDMGANVTDTPPTPHPISPKLLRMHDELGDPTLLDAVEALDQGDLQRGGELLKEAETRLPDSRERLAGLRASV